MKAANRPLPQISYPTLPSMPKRMTGIAPVFDRPVHLEGFKIFNAKSAIKSGEASFNGPLEARKGHTLSAVLKAKWLNKFLDNWIFQEFWFVMNKLSIFGLMMGLMFLGAVFFSVGFLTAFKTIPAGEVSPESSWHTANASTIHRSGGKVHAPIPGSGELGHFGSVVVGSEAQNVALGAAGKVLGVAGKLNGKVPAPLQPFANYASARVNQKTTDTAFEAGSIAKNNSRKILSGQGVTSQGVARPPFEGAQGQRQLSQQPAPYPAVSPMPPQPQGYSPSPVQSVPLQGVQQPYPSQGPYSQQPVQAASGGYPQQQPPQQSQPQPQVYGHYGAPTPQNYPPQPQPYAPPQNLGYR